jgi:hypothetical protein
MAKSFAPAGELTEPDLSKYPTIPHMGQPPAGLQWPA